MATELERKPLGRKNYGHIPHLPGSRMGPGDHMCHEGQARIATERKRDKYDTVIVTEKLDGSNVGVARIDGRVYPLTRAGYLASTSPYEQHWRFADWVDANQDRFLAVLKDGERFVGEWVLQAHGTRYFLSHEPFVVFDLMTGDKRAPYCVAVARAWDAEFQTPAMLSYGTPLSISQVMQELGKCGSHGAHPDDGPEGAVWRVERMGVFDFMVKYVRPDKVDGKYLPEVSGGEPLWNS